MEYVLFIFGLLILLLVIAHFSGNPKFWKVAAKHPIEALNMFESEDCWRVFESKPERGYKSALPGDSKDWVGPFRIYDPNRGRTIIIYGLQSEIEESENRFLAKILNKSKAAQRN